jgi:hypothetical protein
VRGRAGQEGSDRVRGVLLRQHAVLPTVGQSPPDLPMFQPQEHAQVPFRRLQLRKYVHQDEQTVRRSDSLFQQIRRARLW